MRSMQIEASQAGQGPGPPGRGGRRVTSVLLLDRLARITAGLTAGLVLYYGSLPGCPLFYRLILLGSCSVGAVILLACAVLSLARPGWRALRRPVAGMLALVLVCGLLAATLWPLRVRVLLSEPWLRAHARALLAGENIPRYRASTIGLFRVATTARRGDTVYFLTGEHELFAVAGIVYAPAGPAPEAGDAEHLFGPWYRSRSLDSKLLEPNPE